MDLPKSIPMTGPFTFALALSSYRANVEENGLMLAARVADDVARGSYSED